MKSTTAKIGTAMAGIAAALAATPALAQDGNAAPSGLYVQAIAGYEGVEVESSGNTTTAKLVGDMSIDQEALLVSWQGQPINLSGTEFRMLAKLVRVPGHAVSYDTLMNATMQSLVTNNTINTH